ncbi:MAG: metal-dependent hydrolase [Promethearchaeota archaeon]
MGYITYNLYCLFFGTNPTGLGIAFGIIFGLIPDFDIILFLKDLLKGDKSKRLGKTFKHHEFPTHYPILYSPLIILVIFIPNIYTITIITTIYLHLLLDTFYTSDGIKWLYPFNRKFYVLLSDKTIGKQGAYWEKAYKTTIFFKLEFILLAIAEFFLWWNHFYYYKTPTWSLILIGILAICFFLIMLLIERWRSRYIDSLIAEDQENQKSFY